MKEKSIAIIVSHPIQHWVPVYRDLAVQKGLKIKVFFVAENGAFEYFDALDFGISQAVAGNMSAQEALDGVAATWEEITDRLGRESQLELYQQSLGIE